MICILCKSIVRSEDVWKVHINAKQHKQNLELAKQLKEKTVNLTLAAESLKRAASSPLPTDVPFKQPKSILRNPIKSIESTNSEKASIASPTASTINENVLPSDFFDSSSTQSKNYFESTLKKTNIKADLVSIKRGNDGEKTKDPSGIQGGESDQNKTELPEGFFDDPIKDAKARHSEYKDPVEEEWEKFQQEIKEASNFSNAIIAEDQEEAITERQIDEIDEQMQNWNRLVDSLLIRFKRKFEFFILVIYYHAVHCNYIF